jgi:hypothetical protein
VGWTKAVFDYGRRLRTPLFDERAELAALTCYL